MGKTKLFLKLSAVDLLDKRRAVALGVFATKFNRCVRGWLCRVKVRKWRASVAALSWFSLRALRFRAWQRCRQLAAAVCLQAHVVCFINFRLRSRRISSCCLLQSLLRSLAATGQYASARRAHAAATLQSRWRACSAACCHRHMLRCIGVAQRALRCCLARRSIRSLKLQARDVSNLRQQKADLENVVAELRRELSSERDMMSQLKFKIGDLEKENVQLQGAARAPCGADAKASSEDQSQLQAAQARCGQLEEELRAAQESLELLQRLHDSASNDVAAAQTEAAAARSERDKLLTELHVAQMQNERLSVSSAKLAAAAAQSPTATNFYKAQASPLAHDPTLEPVAAASMDAAAMPRRSSHDAAADGKGASLLEKGQLKFQAKRGVGSPPISPPMSAVSPHTPLGRARCALNTSSVDATIESADDALAGIHALLSGCVPGALEQPSHSDLHGLVKSLCSEVLVLRRVVTNTERAGTGAGGSGAASPRTPRSTSSFMPFMPKTPLIPPGAAMPERLRMVEVKRSGVRLRGT
jgi:myosin heavy subunit